MRPTVSSGDLTLAALPATEETFAPYGRLLLPGERTYLGKRRRVLTTIETLEPGPRRVTQVQRYPEAKRVLVPLGDVALWIVVLAPGDKPGRPPAAFLLSPGCGAVLDEGVWHAGPVPLEKTTVLELLETAGVADRFDRRHLKDLVEIAGARVVLREEPGAPRGGLDLSAPNAVLLESALHGRLRLACLLVEDLEVETVHRALREELDGVADALRAMWRHAGSLGQIPGVSDGREAWRALGLDPARTPPRSETLLQHVLAGKAPARENSLEEALALCALRMRVPLAAYDAAALGDQLSVRTGASGEGYPGEDGRRVALEGRPVLCDAQGPFGSPVGDAQRTRVGLHTRRALVVLYAPPRVDEGAIASLLDGVETTLLTHLGARAVSRLVLG
jgi:DNA/RNA-binding domain of Phe-tRNA-synthetase-like protein/ureidoglycolate hydrolase